jgi:GMP synthase-like glutamine amidotransferase
MLIGILTTGHAPDALRPTYGDYPDLFQKLLADQGFDFRDYSVVDMEFPADVHDCDGWLLTGSRHGAYEPHPFIPPLEDFIRKSFAEGVPMVGICFGHQVIAQALGGKVEKYAGGWSVGRTEYNWGGNVVALNAWHQDQVVQAPAGAQICASSDFCENAALVYDDRIFTVQAHPEFTQEWTRDIIEKRGRGLVPDPLLDAAQDRSAKPVDNALLAHRIGTFFRTRQVAA